MNVKAGEHTFVAGRTGSGKTFLVKQYLKYPKRKLFVLDIKKTLDLGKDGVSYITKLSDLKLRKKYKKVVYQPDHAELNLACYNEFFEYCYQQENCIVWVDELMGVGTETKFPEYYKALMTRGRELDISVWSVTQRPKRIPILAMSESTHYFIFDLNMMEDRERITAITGREDFLERPGKFNFWYYNQAKDSKPVLATLTKKEVKT